MNISTASNESISIVSNNSIELDIYTDEDYHGNVGQCVDYHFGTFTVTATITVEEVIKATQSQGGEFEDIADYIIQTHSEILGSAISETDSSYGFDAWDSQVNAMVIEDIVDCCCDEKIKMNEDGSATVVWTADLGERVVADIPSDDEY